MNAASDAWKAIAESFNTSHQEMAKSVSTLHGDIRELTAKFDNHSSQFKDLKEELKEAKDEHEALSSSVSKILGAIKALLVLASIAGLFDVYLKLTSG